MIGRFGAAERGVVVELLEQKQLAQTRSVLFVPQLLGVALLGQPCEPIAQRPVQASALQAASSRARSPVFFSSYAATHAPADSAVIRAQPELATFKLLGAVRLLGQH